MKVGKRGFGGGAAIAAIAALAAVPASASAGGRECGAVTAYGSAAGAASVKASGVSCRTAKRYVRRCVIDGDLKAGWQAKLNRTRGKMKLTKGDRKIVAVLEGGDTNQIEECLDASPSG